MIDPRTDAVLIRNRETGVFEDDTRKIARCEVQPRSQRIGIVFKNQS